MEKKKVRTKKDQKKIIYQKVLKKITPNKEDIKQEIKIVEEIRNKVNKFEGKHSHLEWCGSSARGTHLKSDRDLDLFLMFNKEMSSNELEKEGIRVGKNIFRGHFWEKAYSQHPYIRGIIKGFDIEIVPSFIVNNGSEIKSAVDRTPFHNKYLLAKMNSKKKNDARLLKQFLKGIKAYGADLKNCSLPGYGVELLILYYKSFDKTLKAISKWKKGTIIKFNEEKNPFFSTPLTIIDPVDPNRNVAFALSDEQFERIVYAATKFLAKPNIKFFFPKNKKPWDKRKIKTMLKKKELIGIKGVFPKNTLPDLVWGQLRKFEKKVSRKLKEEGFLILQEKMWSDEKEVWFIFELNTLLLQKAKKIIGPKSNDLENINRFLERKRKIISGPRVENERIVIEIERTKTKANEIINDFLKTEKRKEKKSIKQMLKNIKILTENDLIKEYEGDFKLFFTNYLKGKEVFE